MTVPGITAPLHRDLLVGILALGLLAAPLWIGAVNIGEPTYTYDRTAVTTTDTGIEYADPDAVPHDTPISHHIGCAGWGGDLRACSFERYLLEEESVPTDVYGTNPNSTSVPSVLLADYYRYVQIESTIYEPTYVTNTSAQRGDGMYRLDLALEPADPDDVLYWVSLDGDSVPSVVADTAREGTTTTTEEAAVPETPIRLDDDTYYRVYQERITNEPSARESRLSSFLTYVPPFIGLYIVVRLSRRIDVTYVGKDSDE